MSPLGSPKLQELSKNLPGMVDIFSLFLGSLGKISIMYAMTDLPRTFLCLLREFMPVTVTTKLHAEDL